MNEKEKKEQLTTFLLNIIDFLDYKKEPSEILLELRFHLTYSIERLKEKEPYGVGIVDLIYKNKDVQDFIQNILADEQP